MAKRDYFAPVRWLRQALRRRRAQHGHAFLPIGGDSHAPTVDGGHTEFAVLRCACGAVDVFPRFNFALTTPEYRAEFDRGLAAEGLRWCDDEADRR